MKNREKRPLGDIFNLTNYGVNLTRLAPGGVSALRHAHSGRTSLFTFFKASRRLSPMSGKCCFDPACALGSRRALETAINL